MDANDIDIACEFTATALVGLIAHGLLPTNVWAFVRAIDIAGQPGQVAVWTVLASPN